MLRQRRALTGVLALLIAAASLPLAEGAAQGNSRYPGGLHLLTFTHALTPPERADVAALAAEVDFFDTFPGARASLSPGAHRLLANRPYVERIDPETAVELHLDRAEALIRALSLPEETGLTGKGVTVAVVDSGLDPNHPDLRGRVKASLRYLQGRWVEAPVDTEGHGTHVAGILAGSGEASGGKYRGIAPGVEIVSLDFSGSFTTGAAIAAFDWIHENHDAMGIRIVTNSWGRADGRTRNDPDDPVIRATDRLVEDGLLVLFSAANKGPGPRTLSAEAMNPNVLAIGATDAAGVIAPFSSRGPAVDAKSGRDLPWVKPDLVADGTNVWSLRSPSATPDPLAPATTDLEYQALSGTSQAVPQVAGVAALMLEANPDLTPKDLMRLLKESAIDLGAPGADPEYGHGLLDARDAIALARGQSPDRGNVLVAGGEETSRVEGRLLPAGDRALLLTPRPSVADGGELRIPLAVKPDSYDLRLDLTWRPQGTTFRVTLENGDRVVGPFSSAKQIGDSLLLQVQPGNLAAGDWTVVATPDAPPLQPLDYAFTATQRLPAHPERAGGFEATYRAPVPGGAPAPAEAEGTWEGVAAEIEGVVGLPLLTIGVAGAVAAGLVGAWVLRRRDEAGSKG